MELLVSTFEGVSPFCVLFSRMDCSALSFRIQLCFISCGFSVVLCHEWVCKNVLLYTEGQQEVTGLFPAAGVACKCSAFERDWGYDLLQIVLFILVQLFSFSGSEDQFICAVKRSDKFMDAQNPPAGIERAHDFGFCGSLDRLLPSLPCCGGALQLFRLVGQIYFLCLPLFWCPSSLQRQCLLSKHKYSHFWACPGAPVFLEALSVWCLLIVDQCNSRDPEKALCSPVLFTLVWMTYVHIFPWRKQVNLVHGVIGTLPKSPTHEVDLPFNHRMTDSLRTGCTIPVSITELPKDQCVRLQIPSGM